MLKFKKLVYKIHFLIILNLITGLLFTSTSHGADFPNYFLELRNEIAKSDVELDPTTVESRTKSEISEVLNSLIKRVNAPFKDKNGRTVSKNFFESLKKALQEKDSDANTYLNGETVQSFLGVLYAEIYNSKKRNPEKSITEILKEIKTQKRSIPILDVIRPPQKLGIIVQPSAESKSKEEGAQLALTAHSFSQVLSDDKLGELQVEVCPGDCMSTHPEGHKQSLDHLSISLNSGTLATRGDAKLLDSILFKGEYECEKEFRSQDDIIACLSVLLECPFLSPKVEDQSDEVKGVNLVQAIETLPLEPSHFSRIMAKGRLGSAQNRLLTSHETFAKVLREKADRLFAQGQLKRRLIPFYLEEKAKSQDLNQSFDHLLLPREAFLDKFTHHGKLFHGTPEFSNIVSIVGNHPLPSDTDKNQGRSVFGPGFYTTKEFNLASKYGVPLEFNIRKDKELRILNWEEALKNDAFLNDLANGDPDLVSQYKNKKKYPFNEAAKRYGIDVFVVYDSKDHHWYPIIQNSDVLEMPKSTLRAIRPIFEKAEEFINLTSFSPTVWASRCADVVPEEKSWNSSQIEEECNFFNLSRRLEALVFLTKNAHKLGANKIRIPPSFILNLYSTLGAAHSDVAKLKQKRLELSQAYETEESREKSNQIKRKMEIIESVQRAIAPTLQKLLPILVQNGTQKESFLGSHELQHLKFGQKEDLTLEHLMRGMISTFDSKDNEAIRSMIITLGHMPDAALKAELLHAAIVKKQAEILAVLKSAQRHDYRAAIKLLDSFHPEELEPNTLKELADLIPTHLDSAIQKRITKILSRSNLAKSRSAKLSVSQNEHHLLKYFHPEHPVDVRVSAAKLLGQVHSDKPHYQLGLLDMLDHDEDEARVQALFELAKIDKVSLKPESKDRIWKRRRELSSILFDHSESKEKEDSRERRKAAIKVLGSVEKKEVENLVSMIREIDRLQIEKRLANKNVQQELFKKLSTIKSQLKKDISLLNKEMKNLGTNGQIKSPQIQEALIDRFEVMHTRLELLQSLVNQLPESVTKKTRFIIRDLDLRASMVKRRNEIAQMIAAKWIPDELKKAFNDIMNEEVDQEFREKLEEKSRESTQIESCD